jgi:uncharacterized CHY-type Zn-finger protein
MRITPTLADVLYELSFRIDILDNIIAHTALEVMRGIEGNQSSPCKNAYPVAQCLRLLTNNPKLLCQNPNIKTGPVLGGQVIVDIVLTYKAIISYKLCHQCNSKSKVQEKEEDELF